MMRRTSVHCSTLPHACSLNYGQKLHAAIPGRASGECDGGRELHARLACIMHHHHARLACTDPSACQGLPDSACFQHSVPWLAQHSLMTDRRLVILM